MAMKRPANDAGPDPKRASNGPITHDDIETFQKEAIWRQMNLYRRERDALRSELESLAESGDAGLREQLEETRQRWLDAAKQVERLESTSVARVMAKTQKHTPEEDGTDESGPADTVPELSSKEAINLKTELAGALASSKATTLQLEHETELRERTERELREAEQGLSALPAEIDGRKKLIAEIEMDNARLQNALREIHATLAELETQKAEYEHTVRNKYESQRADLDRRATQAEADLARIRAARDELLGELGVVKATMTEQQRELDGLRHDLAEPLKPPKPLSPPDQSAPVAVDADVGTLVRQNRALALEISGLEAAVRQVTVKARDAFRAKAGAEQKLGQVVTAKAKADEKYFGAMRARDAQGLELGNAKKALVKNSETIAELRVLEKSQSSQITRLRSKINEHEVAVREADRRAVTAERGRLNIAAQLDSSTKALEVAKDQLVQRDLQLREAVAARRKADIAAERAQAQLETQRAISGLGNPTEVQEQLESLRSIALCSVCHKNWKDSALTTCGHVLCGDCVRSRLAARMRKCPLCNAQFQQSDVLAVHL